MRSERGFTLIEVMVATAVMAVGIASALELFGGSMRLASASANQTRALVVARSLLDEALWRAELEDGSRSGSVGRYDWNLEIYTTERQFFGLDEGDGFGFEDDTDYMLWEIAATVRWTEGSRDKSLRITTARLSENF